MFKLFRYAKPYRVPIAVVLALVFLQSLAELYLPTLLSDIVDTGIVNGDIPYIWKIGGFMLLVAALSMVCSIGASYLSARIAAGFGKVLRGRVFTHVENFSLQEFDQIGTSSLITRTTNDITQVQQVLTMMLRMMVGAPMMCIGGIIMAVSKDAKLSLVLVVVIPVIALSIALIGFKGVKLFRAMQGKVDNLNRVLRESLTGIRVIRAFNRVDDEKRRFNETNRDLTGTALQASRLMAAMQPLMMLILNVSTIAIIWFGGLRIDAGHMQVGDLMAFIQYATQIMFSLMMLSMMFVMIPRASVSAVRINEVLETVPDIAEPAQPKQSQARTGEVEFRDVTFSYPGAEKAALSRLSFRARPGQVTAIIGGTGAGKSTLVSLLPRFYDADSGMILIDGLDVRDHSQEALRAKIGLVPQQAVLFTGTVADNIRFGKGDATDAEVAHAAEVAQASEFITALPDGFDSPIAQGGANLSGGQKQRLSIARALVRRPEIYVFDDSFSALDFKTDAKLRAALRQETGAATVIIVAQRVSTVRDADQILVLEEGELAGVGTHQELMETCEVYREIVTSQLSEEVTA